jgi:hypothetical protein
MSGPVTRWLRRPVSWKTGLTLADVLFFIAFVGAGAVVVLLLILAAWGEP